jgi:predicted Zn-dependent peptidase
MRALGDGKSLYAVLICGAIAAGQVFVCAAQHKQMPQKDPARPAQRSAQTSEVPKRPEKLKFPPLEYHPPKPEDYRVVLKSGPVGYVVEDRELPLVNIVVYVRTGEYTDTPERKGLASLAGYLIARGGTEKRTAEELEERLAFLAAELSSGVGDTQGNVRLNLLAKDLPEGMEILREVLTSPRFQEDKIDLRKRQMIQAMRQRNDDSGAIEAREAAYLAFGEEFWANQHPTPATVNPLTQQDLLAFHKSYFWPSNFVLAVSGDFDRQEMIGRLEKLFSDWPWRGETAPQIPTNTVFAAPGAYILDKDVNQGRVSLILPGIMRQNPDYFPVLMMNDILGGGGFTSRIMNRVRSDEGLAYSAFSRFPGGIYYPLPFTAGFQTKSRTVAYATSIVLEEIRQIATTAVREEELATSRQAFIERLPQTFATKTQVANTFAQDEFTGRYAREPDFWQKYRPRIEGVNKDEIERVAQKYLQTNKLVLLVVGQKDQVLLGHPNHPVQLKELVNGSIRDLPPRDPLTLKPVAGKSNP